MSRWGMLWWHENIIYLIHLTYTFSFR
jgi:hypothetical protein